ncbi:MAG TPA: penicillin acylase family protein, partial [Fimbriimonadaceae bacterium]|nr:penicillin acylase family protein [Fimbriimonadaceae bacterium]
MLCAFVCLVAGLQAPPIQRDAYGVPLVTAASVDDAYFNFGKVVAQDRLWQMEMSRRVARGKMAEVFGRQALSSDRDLVKTGYTDEEIQQQIDALPPSARKAFEQYAKGVNDTIDQRTKDGTLPPGYAKYGFAPEPWTPVDSAAIAIHLLQQFGTGGAGELRNYALLLYLRGQKAKDKVLDVIDDLAWQNEPLSVPTVTDADDPLAKNHPQFAIPTRAQTEAHIASLPAASILELFPAIQLTTGENTDLLAEQHSVATHFGSYAVVVGPSRSRTGNAFLLSAPQMGHADPSVIHEVAIKSPGLNVAGIDVPGVPAVVIGNTPNFAWGLTSGVADVQDVFFSKLADDDHYTYGTETRDIEKIERTINVKDADPVKVEVLRTHHGPVILNSRVGKCLYSVQSSFWKRELSGIASLMTMYNAKTPVQIEDAIRHVPVTFNFFYATTSGDFGYQYTGLVPFRAKGYDPRFPTPDDPTTEWQGFVSASSMPHVESPKSGMLANWNNKPASWWPNFDTPVWGSPFRNDVLLRALPSGKIGRFDLEHAAWEIARRETETSAGFLPDFKAILDAQAKLGTKDALVEYLDGWDGWDVDGSVGALIYAEAVRQLRRELFEPALGSFLQPSIFETVIQPETIRKALRGET